MKKFWFAYFIWVISPGVLGGSIGAYLSTSCGVMEESVDYLPDYCYYMYEEEYLNKKLKGKQNEG